MPTQICDLMTQEVVSVAPDMSLKEVDRVLLSYGVSGAPVVEDGVLVGVVSRADVVRFLYAEQSEAARISGFYTSPFPIPIPALEQLARGTRRITEDMAHKTVREIMSTDVRAVSPQADVREVASLMASEGFHRVPVLEQGKLVGIVTSLDLVRRLAEVGLAEG